MHHTVDETPQREARAESSRNFPVSRKRFLVLSAAWTVGLATFMAAGCAGEEDEDDGGEDDD